MDYKNTNSHFGIIAILLHWGMAMLLIGMVALGLYMTNLPTSLQKLKLVGWHKEFGMLVLFLAIIRLLWRSVNVLPTYSGLTRFEAFAARLSHAGFYVLMIALPLTGWLISSTKGIPFSFFGLFLIPNLSGPDPVLHDLMQTLHTWLAYALIALFVLHVLAALKHHFINKDNILRRML